MENTIKMGDLGVPLFPETSKWISLKWKQKSQCLLKMIPMSCDKKSYDSTKKNYIIFCRWMLVKPLCFTVFSSTSSCRKCAMWPGAAGASDEVHYEVWLGAKALGNLNVAECKTGWWFGTSILFSHILGIIIPIDELIFFRGVEKTTNRCLICSSGFSDDDP